MFIGDTLAILRSWRNITDAQIRQLERNNI